jgi:hypothetical protein
MNGPSEPAEPESLVPLLDAIRDILLRYEFLAQGTGWSTLSTLLICSPATSLERWAVGRCGVAQDPSRMLSDFGPSIRWMPRPNEIHSNSCVS